MFDADLLASYDYRLPENLIATVPAARRDGSRLMHVDRAGHGIRQDKISHFPELLNSGDLLVLNETRVIPARLVGVRTQTGGKWEGLYLGSSPAGAWRLIGRTRGRLRPGETLSVHAPAGAGEPLLLTLLEQSEGEWTAQPQSQRPALELLERFGRVPLPPYLNREDDAADRVRYQTVFAATPGAIAAPTAGLHFTPELLDACRARGVDIAFVTLHVGVGTFRPVAAQHLSDHVMHAEWCCLPQETVTAINATRERRGRVVAVGTTTVRTLESVAADGPLRSWSGETRLFIRPPYQFQVVDALLTNFHLPRSTLLVLVSAFAGRDLILSAYQQAIEAGYRFFSYGDAMFIK